MSKIYSYSIYRNTPQFSMSTITLKPRFETVVLVTVLNPNNIREGIITNQTTVVNKGTQKLTVSIPKLLIEEIPKASYVHSISSNNTKSICSTLLNICHEFNDSFHCLDDILTQANATFHEIITSDEKPIRF